MKKLILFAALALLPILLLAQTQDDTQAQAQEQTQVQPPAQAPEQPQAEAPQHAQDKNLKKISFPKAFIHAGKEYPAGDYWLVLTEKEGKPLFTVSNAQQEPLFEDLAIVKVRSGGRTGSSFRVNKQLMKDGEYFRVKVTTPGQWLMGYFLVKK